MCHHRLLAITLAAIVLALAPAVASEGPVYPAGSDVPPLGKAVVEAFLPQARMIDDSTCELIAAVRKPDGSIMREGEGYLALSRQGARGSFIRGYPREDGLVVLFFPAQTNEKISGRGWVRRPTATRHRYARGPAINSICRSGTAKVGEPIR